MIQIELPFLLPTQEDKRRLGSQQKIKQTDKQKTKKQTKHGRDNCDGYTAGHKIFPINVRMVVMNTQRVGIESNNHFMNTLIRSPNVINRISY